MSLAIKYETVDDARMRLKNTVVLYKGVPHLIRDINRGEGDDIFRVLSVPLPVKIDGLGRVVVPEGEEQRKFISSKHFDIAPFKVGYVNVKTGAFYVTRLPNRIQKQGFCSENFKATDVKGSQISFTKLISYPEFVDTVNGVFPTFQQALKALDKTSLIAFSRDFAVSRDLILPDRMCHIHHKGSRVGIKLDGVVVLGKNFLCLKESLAELGVQVSEK
jgi:hypothetical protein